MTDEIVKLIADGYAASEQERGAVGTESDVQAEAEYDQAEDELPLHMRLVHGFEKFEKRED